MVKKIMKKRGLSPLITTAMLIALVIVIIAVIFFWFLGMVQEGVTKFGKNIQLVCEEVQFQADYDSGKLNIVNNGDIPIYNLNVKMIDSGGTYTTEEIKKMTEGEEWPTTGLKQGEAFTKTKAFSSGTLELNPVLIGTSKSGKKTFVCGGDYGQKISI
jgi:flagellin-like protein